MRKSVQFIVSTCFLSWIVAGVAILLGLRIDNMLPYTIFVVVYMFLPAVFAIILQVTHKEKPFRNLRISFRLNRWFLIAGITPIVYAFLTLGINLLFPGVSFSSAGYLMSLPAETAEAAAQQLSRYPPAVSFLMQIGNALIMGYTANAFFAFGEELGWRGYLLRALKGKKFLYVSLVTGTVWGLWHFPLILLGHNYPQHPAAGVCMMTVWCILISPVMTYITIKSKSVIAAAIFHGTLNAIAGIDRLYLTGGNDLTNGAMGLAGILCLLLVNCAFFLYDKYITKENIFIRTIET